VQGASASKAYEHRIDWLQTIDTPQSASSVISFSNSSRGGLGDQLPAGTVRVYIRDAKGQPQFIGESAIPHTPMGSELAIRTGDAFDVKVKSAVVKRERITTTSGQRSARFRITSSRTGTEIVTVERSPVYWRTTMAYTLTNARPAPSHGRFGSGRARRLLARHGAPSAKTVPGTQRSLDERLYHVTVPANGETVVTAAFDTRY
jgi:hypothetical protein